MIKTTSYQIGDIVRVNDSHLAALPEGLPAGSDVRIVGIVQAYRLVEWDGQLFEIDMANVDA